MWELFSIIARLHPGWLLKQEFLGTRLEIDWWDHPWTKTLSFTYLFPLLPVPSLKLPSVPSMEDFVLPQWAHLFLHMLIASTFPAYHHCPFNLVYCDRVAEPYLLGLLDPGVLSSDSLSRRALSNETCQHPHPLSSPQEMTPDLASFKCMLIYGWAWWHMSINIARPYLKMIIIIINAYCGMSLLNILPSSSWYT